MKVVIAGPRDCENYVSLLIAIHLAPFDITEVVSGGATGADAMGERWSKEVLRKKPKVFPADWDRWGKGAGPKRNREMAEYSDAAIILWNGRSTGTRSMLKIAKAEGIGWFVYGVEGYRPRPGRKWASFSQDEN